MNHSGAFAVSQLNPLADSNWQDLLSRHPAASVFHCAGWLQALQRTYGYEPVVFTTSRPAVALTNGLLCVRIRSRLTGSRIVSLPFSDHCTPLCQSQEELETLLLYLQKESLCEKRKYIELRPLISLISCDLEKLGFASTGKYLLHRVDLEPSEGELFRRLHKNCVQRRIRHAERVGVREECGNTEKHLRDFFGLMVRTRIRHGMPPQPFAWFRNLLECMKDYADLRVAYLNDIPVAAIISLHFLDKSYFKYGCSDERFHSSGAFPFLLWRVIVKAKSIGSKVLDLGRTDHDAGGLVTFKNHWTSWSNQLNYWAWAPSLNYNFARARTSRLMKNVFGVLPRSVIEFAGSTIYRHFG